jgi:cellulose synthase/poly-beta-1,6-N-acetylglucosamine synthase-like glycosyltransferase
VSVIVPVEGECSTLSQSVEALLGLNYPELEVVVVAGSVSERSLDSLKNDWVLEPRELFYRRIIDTSPVNRILCSERDPRLVVIEKAAAGRADALNCGVSFARYRYVVSVNPGIAFDADALLRLMSPALRDPGAVLAVTSYVERRAAASAAPGPLTSDPGRRTADPGWIAAADDYQRLASIRSWMASRLAWHQLQCGLPPRDGVTAWRRDAVMELGGFSTTAADPELDLLVRLQTSRSGGPSGRVVRTSEVFGHAATSTVRGAAALASRRQNALIEALRTFRRAPGKDPMRRTMTIVVGVELLTSLAQGTVAVLIVAAALAGWVSWRTPYLTFLLLTFGYAVVSASALLLRGGTPGAPSGADLKRLLLRAPLEFAVYRPALVWARIVGR